MLGALEGRGARVALRAVERASATVEMLSAAAATGRLTRAEDGPARWAIAAQMEADRSALLAVSDAITTSRVRLDTATLVVSGVREQINEIMNILVLARQPGIDRFALQVELDGHKSALADVLRSGDSGNFTLLQHYDFFSPAQDVTYVTGLSRSSAGLAVQTTTLERDDVLIAGIPFSASPGILGTFEFINGTFYLPATIAVDWASDSAADLAHLDNLIIGLGRTQDKVVRAETTLGLLSARLAEAAGLMTLKGDTLASAISALVDYDLEDVAVRLRAAMAQERLALEALSIANASQDYLVTLIEGSRSPR